MKANETTQQYIKKSDLVAEIERRRSKNAKNKLNLAASFEDNYLLSYLDTLEVKETNLDKEIESYFKGFGKFVSVGIDDCIDIAKHFFELGMKMAQKGDDSK
jgi:hypothetical protein